MSIDELKQNIEQRTGVPAAIIQGETSEEVIAHAKALLAFKLQEDAKAGRTESRPTKELFAMWINGEEEKLDPNIALANIEKENSYPNLKDSGELPAGVQKESTQQLFAQWFNNPARNNLALFQRM